MANPTTGINRYYLIQYLEDISELSIGPDPNVNDIAEDLVLQFIKEGYQRIISLDNRWPWLESVYEFNTVNGQRSYSTGLTMTQTYATTITVPQTGISLSDIRQFINLVNNTNAGNELVYLDQHVAERIWVGSSDQPNIPAYYSIWAGEVNLWPKPNGVYNLTARGYREPSLTWLNQPDSNSTDYVDLDQELHITLVNFVMMRIFQFQEDPEMAQVYQRHFQEGVAIIQQNLTAPNSNQNLILSGGLQLNPYGYWWNTIPTTQVLPGTPFPIGRVW